MTNLALTGLILGIGFGFVLQRGRFCMNSAFRDIITGKDYTLFKSVGVALLVQMVGFATLAAASIITLNPKPLVWGGNIIGGFIFGIGMVIAGGCASGITYRVGEGMGGAFTALIGFSLTAFLTKYGFLKPIKDALQSSTKVTGADGANLTLASIFGLNPIILAYVLAIIVVVIWAYFLRKEGSDDSTRDWSWMSTGVAIGLIGIIAFPLSAATGRMYPLGITSGWANVLKVLLPGEGTVSWEGWLVIGVIIGAFVAAFAANELKLRMPSWKTMVATFCGGLLMGFGAVVSSGCNVGHILSGVPQLSLGSILGGIFIVLGGWAAAWLMFIRPMKA